MIVAHVMMFESFLTKKLVSKFLFLGFVSYDGHKVNKVIDVTKKIVLKDSKKLVE